MKIDYTHAKELCNVNEFSLLEQCKPRTLMKFSGEELKLKIHQAQTLVEKSAGEKKRLFAEAVGRLERRLALREKEPVVESGGGFVPAGHAGGGSAAPLSLKNQAKQNAILSGQRIDASGLNTRVKGHVAARGRRREAAREARNG